MKGLYQIIKFISSLGRLCHDLSYDPTLHRFTAEHFLMATKGIFAVFLILCLLLVAYFFLSKWYSRLLTGIGNRAFEQGNHAQAVQSYTHAIKWHPWYAKAYHYRALAKVALGQPAEASSDFTEAHKLDSSWPLPS